MAQIDDLIATIAELGKDETDYQAREQATVDALTKTVADLQAQLAAGTVDLTAPIASLKAIIAAIPSAVAPAVPAA